MAGVATAGVATAGVATAEVGERPDEARRLAGALHEVSNALTVVMGWLDAAGRDAGSPGAQRALEIALTHARRGHRVAREAIGARTEHEQLPVSAACIAEDAVLGVKNEAAQRGVGVSLVRRAGAAVMVDAGDRALQVVLNLLLNAIAFTPADGHVELAQGARDGFATFTIRDEGPGVPSDRADSLFDGPVSTRRGGAGIGLTHSHELAAQHGGRLELSDAGGCGRGAEFVLYWPIVEGASGLRHAVAPTPRHGAALMGRNILVIEDDFAVSSLIELTLESRGATVCIASNCDELAMQLAAERFDAALVDLSPLHEPARQLMELRSSLGTAPIVLISGSAGADAPLGSFDGWVRKPFEMSELVEALVVQFER